MELTARQSEILSTMGIERWGRQRGGGSALVENDAAGRELDTLAGEVAKCTGCSLHATRTHTVFGSGNPCVDWLFVGEAPGRDEDRQGQPFVGRAGQLLTRMIQALGLARDQVYIANILKCRPPNNRDPLPEEVACCEPFLHRQLELISPKVIVALGRVSAQALLKTQQPLGRLRGQTFTYGAADTPLIATYHPAYLLRSPLEKRKAWQDLRRAQALAATATLLQF
ncbi:MAG: uracil-DNA glycosylase [Pseudomonadota bacterium]|nr:uracil-DNA glycosylase [Pseudomonadota bacterium]